MSHESGVTMWQEEGSERDRHRKEIRWLKKVRCDNEMISCNMYVTYMSQLKDFPWGFHLYHSVVHQKEYYRSAVLLDLPIDGH